jgi:hypothetical protein
VYRSCAPEAPFSHGLRRVIRDVPLGSLLIQSDPARASPCCSISTCLSNCVAHHEPQDAGDVVGLSDGNRRCCS